MKKYLLKRAIFLVLTLIISTYLVVLIANAGGRIDNILCAQIKYDITTRLARSPGWAQLPEATKIQMIAERMDLAIRAKGLDKPFFERTLIYLWDALSLQLGRALFLTSASGTKQVSTIILERLPRTLLLFTTGTIGYSLIGLFIGLRMARSPGSLFDRAMTFFTVVTQSVDAWLFGIIFSLIFAVQFRLVPFGGFTSVPPPDHPLFYAFDVIYHLALPVFTMIFAFSGYWAYITRNLTIQSSLEDYVTVARAKGLPEHVVTQRYILRPSLPPIITMISFATISTLQGGIVTERIFGWPGIGSLLGEAVGTLDAPVVIGIFVIYAYLIVITVFILDVVYSFLDPRIKVGE